MIGVPDGWMGGRHSLSTSPKASAHSRHRHRAGSFRMPSSMETRSHRPSSWPLSSTNTSKLRRHISSSETRLVTMETNRNPLEMTQTFTTDLIMKAIKSSRNSTDFGPDMLSIFHLKYLGPGAIEYITALFILSHNLSDPGYMEFIINHPYTEAWQGHSPRNLLSAHFCSLPSRQSPGNSASTYYQQISPSCSRPSRFQTRALEHLRSATVNNRHFNGIQSEEASISNGLRGYRFIGCVPYGLS